MLFVIWKLNMIHWDSWGRWQYSILLLLLFEISIIHSLSWSKSCASHRNRMRKAVCLYHIFHEYKLRRCHHPLILLIVLLLILLLLEGLLKLDLFCFWAIHCVVLSCCGSVVIIMAVTQELLHHSWIGLDQVLIEGSLILARHITTCRLKLFHMSLVAVIIIDVCIVVFIVIIVLWMTEVSTCLW